MLCVHLETKEIQLEQLVLFESDEMLDQEFKFYPHSNNGLKREYFCNVILLSW